MAQKIRVMVVDDSIVFRSWLIKNLQEDPRFEVIGYAANALDAKSKLPVLKPDIMTLDIEMPGMTGLQFLKEILPVHPIPIILVSSLNVQVFDALAAGAVDFVAKPVNASRQQIEDFIHNDLNVKVKIAAAAQMGNVRKPRLMQTQQHAAPLKDNGLIVAIGASTGGTEAIFSVVKNFGPDIPGVVIVQHMPPGFTEMYAKRLDSQCRVRVKEACTGDRVMRGQVLIAPGGDRHMRLVKVNGVYQVECRPGPKVNGHCPSVDELFYSVANTAGSRALGIILTGMGGDGAKGLLAMRKAGAETIGQDESTCVVYGMRKVAYDIGAVKHQVRLDDIAKKAYSLLSIM